VLQLPPPPSRTPARGLRDARLSHDAAADAGSEGISNAKVKAVTPAVVSL